MYQIILTILSVLFGFSTFYLLGSSRQKAKDDRTLKEYKTETEAVIRDVNRKTAEAQAEKTKSDIEKNLMKETVTIITKPAPESRNEELREQAEMAETDDDVRNVLKAMQEDSQRRAEELGRRYEQ